VKTEKKNQEENSMKRDRLLELYQIKEFSEEQAKGIEQILNIFEGSFEIEPVISQNKLRDFKSPYSYIMQTYKLTKNIKPCIAYTLVNGLADGWRTNSISIAFECLRVCEQDISKAWELMKL